VSVGTVIEVRGARQRRRPAFVEQTYQEIEIIDFTYRGFSCTLGRHPNGDVHQ
jgi:hypothetical protein